MQSDAGRVRGFPRFNLGALGLRSDSTLAGVLFLFVGPVFLAASACWVHASNGALSVSHLVFARCAVFLVLLTPWAIRNRTAALGRNRRWLLIQALAYTAFLFLYVEALLLMPLSIATMLSGTGPLWVICLLWVFFAVPPMVKEIIGIVVVLVGIAVVLQPEGSYGINNLSESGMIIATGAAAASAVAFIAFGKLGSTDPSQTLNLWLSLMGVIVTLPVILTSPMPTNTFVITLALLYGAFALVGQTLMIRATTVLSPAAGSTGNALIPAFAALFGWLFFKETLSLLESFGIAIVIAGVIIVSLLSARQKHPQDLPFRWQRE